MRVRTSLLVTGVALLIVACARPSDEAVSETTVATGSPTSTIETASSTTEASITPETGALDLATLTEAATRDLSRLLAIDEDDIEVVDADLVQWSDGSIGCPEEGQLYTQAIVDGARVVLSAAGRFYDYHAGSDGKVFLCPSEEEDGGYGSNPLRDADD